MTNTLDREGLSAKITAYLSLGGLFNPEMMEHDKVRELLTDCRTYLDAFPPADIAALVERLRELSCHGGCPHDMGFDREMGPLGCALELKGGCLCAAYVPAVREATSALEALASRSPNETLERAARVAVDEAAKCVAGSLPDYVAERIAAAIRAMKEPE